MTDDDAMAELLSEGRRAWPTLRPDPPIANILRRKDGIAAVDLDPAEVYLAAALLAADAGAPTAFEERYFGGIDAALARSRASRDEIDEVRQLLRTRLLLPGDDGVPRLVDYCGSGRLTGLLRVAAMRALLNLRAKLHPSEELDDALANRVAVDLDPVKEEERATVIDAIRATACGLPARSRRLLRLNLVDCLSIDELGRVFGIHRATAARQLARAREELVAGVRERLVERWGSGAESLTLVSSCLDITLGKALATVSDS